MKNRLIAKELLGIAKYLLGPSRMFTEFAGKRIVFFDTETTGLNPHDRQITEIAAVEVDGTDFREKAVFHRKIRLQKRTMEQIEMERTNRPKDKTIEELLETTRYKELDLPEEEETEALEAFRSFASGAVLVAQNAHFDMKMVGTKIGRIPNAGVYDTMLFSRLHLIPTLKVLASRGVPEAVEALSKMRGGGKDYRSNLKSIANALGVTMGGWHQGLEDVRTTVRIMRGIMEFFKKHPVEDEPEVRKEMEMSYVENRRKTMMYEKAKAFEKNIGRLAEFDYTKRTGEKRRVQVVVQEIDRNHYSGELYVVGYDLFRKDGRSFAIGSISGKLVFGDAPKERVNS